MRATAQRRFSSHRSYSKNKLGTLVGRPSGGNQRGINGGAFFFLRLPKSQIEMDLPLIGNFPASPQNDAGLTPDVLVTPTLQDIIEGKDAEMAKVTALQGKGSLNLASSSSGSPALSSDSLHVAG
jgi:hypothetical protein